MAYLAVLAKEGADSVIYRSKNGFGFLIPQHIVVRQIFLELEAAAEGGIQYLDAAVGGVHGAEQAEVGRDSEKLLSVRQPDCHFVLGSQSLVLFYQGY